MSVRRGKSSVLLYKYSTFQVEKVNSTWLIFHMAQHKKKNRGQENLANHTLLPFKRKFNVEKHSK